MASRKIGRKGVFNLRQRTPGIHDKGSLLGSANHENEAPRPKTESRDEMSKYGKCSDCTIRPKAPFTSNVQLISAPMALALKTKPRRRREHGPLQPTSLANGPGKIRRCRSSIPPLPICTTNRPNLRKPRRKIICAIAQALVGFTLRASVASCLGLRAQPALCQSASICGSPSPFVPSCLRAFVALIQWERLARVYGGTQPRRHEGMQPRRVKIPSGATGGFLAISCNFLLM